MIKVAIVHPSLNVAAGAERVAVKTIESLKELGMSVSLFSIDKVKWELLRNGSPITLPDKELFLKQSNIIDSLYHGAKENLRYYLKMLLTVYILKKIKYFDYTISTHGETFNILVDVAYVNAIPLMIPLNDVEEWFPSLRPIKKIYTRIFKTVRPLIEKKTLYITNSEFMKHILRDLWDINPIVINPPVNVGKYIKLSGCKKRENIVVIISRIKWNKGLNKIPLIAKHTKGHVKFIIIGSSIGSSKSLVNYIKWKSKVLGVADRVKLFINISSKDALEIVSKAKVYLHTMRNEAFGISIVEAMAAGCVPVVPMSGGPWTDILCRKQGVYGFAYKTLNQASIFINNLVGDYNLWKEISENAVEHSLKFDEKVFKNKIKSLIKRIF